MKATMLSESMHVSTQIHPVDQNERARIDCSTRRPVLFFFGSSIFWLVIGSLLGLIAAIQISYPTFLDFAPWLTYGRIQPAFQDAWLYGWASQAGLGVGIWLMARLCRVTLRNQPLLIAAGVTWNLGVLLGTLSILAGSSRSLEWLEYPAYVAPILFVAYALIGVWGIVLFRFRKPGHVYVSVWYLIAAFLAFPWLYATANMLLVSRPIQGSAQGAIHAWYVENLIGLWFVPIGLAAAYYMIPKVINRPIYSYYLSILGFWSLILFSAWTGMIRYLGGPFPAWMMSAGVVANVMLLIPVITVAINHHLSMRGHFQALHWSPTLRFTVFGAVAYTLANLQGSFWAIPSLNSVVHFTDYTIGQSQLLLYGFFSMILFGSMYYIIPRLTGWEWASASKIRWHFWLSAIGIFLLVLSLSIGGLLQGLALKDTQVTFMNSIEYARPFRWMRGVAFGLISAGHLIFAILFVQTLLKVGKRKEVPTLFANPTVIQEPVSV